jgi:hypothetical protein
MTKCNHEWVVFEDDSEQICTLCMASKAWLPTIKDVKTLTMAQVEKRNNIRRRMPNVEPSLEGRAICRGCNEPMLTTSADPFLCLHCAMAQLFVGMAKKKDE